MPAQLIAQEGPHQGLIFTLETPGEWIIGRDPETADFVIEDSTVSRKHARIRATDEGIFVTNLSRVNPILINEKETRKQTLLQDQDTLQIGNCLFTFADISREKNPKPPKRSNTQGGYDQIFDDPLGEVSLPDPSSPKVPDAYDTIFEDTDADAELLSFPAASETPFLLKVISGPNTGAEIGLEKGKNYLLGKDADRCDIVFQDLSVSHEHARLTISQEGLVEIEDLGSKNKTLVNQIPIEEKTLITPQDLVSLGTTTFLVLDREAAQETLYSPLPSYEPTEPEPQESLSESEENWKKQPIPVRYWAIVSGCAAIFLMAFISFFSLFKTQQIAPPHGHPEEQLQEALGKFEALQFSYNPGSDTVFIVGHVRTGIDYQEMNYRLEQLPFLTGIEKTVVIDESVCKSINDLIGEMPDWRSVSLQTPKAGQFVLQGYLTTQKQAQALDHFLASNFPYTDQLNNRVAVQEVLQSQIDSLLLQEKIGAVAFELSNGDVLFTGRYSKNQKSSYQDLLKKIGKLPGIRSVKDFAVATSPNQASIDITEKYAVSGSSSFEGRGYSVILNGRIYTLGDQVDGMKLASIQPNTILLEKDGLKYKIDYTQ